MQKSNKAMKQPGVNQEDGPLLRTPMTGLDKTFLITFVLQQYLLQTVDTSLTQPWKLARKNLLTTVQAHSKTPAAGCISMSNS